jgi:hypothetical protein
MSAEIAVVVVLAYIAWCLERLVRKLHDIYVELGTIRWEAGKRESLARRALDRIAGVRPDEPDPPDAEDAK